MPYSPTDWKDRIVQSPLTYDVTNNPDGSITLTPRPGTITQEGTPMNATNFNKMETGIVEASKIYDTLSSKAYRWVLEGDELFLEEV